MRRAATELELDEIQGNILAGFSKDFASFLLFSLPPDEVKARAWLAELVDEVATTSEVKAFNDLFRTTRARRRGREVVAATWMNLGFTLEGLRALGVPQTDRGKLPDDFQQGMRARAAQIGDNGRNAPGNWPVGLGSPSTRIDALMIVASDRIDDRNDEVGRFVSQAVRHDVRLVFRQDGMTRPDAPGHEHFGFKDGISQPGIVGFDDGHLIPGQDPIEPGEFVLGYPRQLGADEPPPLEPSWLKNGSYLVFRRLRQDVAGFHRFIRDAAARERMTEDLLGAKLVGRYRSGAPLEGAGNTASDPADTDPSTVDDQHINNFDYHAGDPDGYQVPRAAHIRKTYPRDQQPPGEDEAQRHRILRRGIPFGRSFHEGGPPRSPFSAGAKFPDDRGLCFVCYQRSIVDQFEFIQSSFVNCGDFPQPRDGVDPIISQADEARQLAIPDARHTPLALSKQWVTTTGGEYFLAPSISALKQFASV